MFFVGLDIGSTITKIVIRESTGDYVSVVRPTGVEQRRLADSVMEEALKKASLALDQVNYIVATGYGRFNVPFADSQLSEITCHTKGVSLLFPHVRTIIDIGGQDSKGIRVVNGKVHSFVMNDKCAAGTGRFLEAMADLLGIRLEDMVEISLRSNSPVVISKTCTVFAEQEVMLHLSEHVALEDILAGVHQAFARRIISIVSKIDMKREVVLTGGGAKNAGLVKYLDRQIGFPLTSPSEPLITGALGAALAAEQLWQRSVADGTIQQREKRILAPVSFFDDPLPARTN